MTDQKTNAVSRRSFIRNASFATAFLVTGNLRKLSTTELYQMRGKVAMRFVVASDAHYGQPNTAFDEMIEKVINQINLFHKENPLDFCVINGDLIHNEKPLLPKVKQKLDELTMPWHITRGNHDMVTEDEWKTVFNKPLNYDAVVKKNALIFGDTSNEKGTYLSPDLVWLKAKFDEHKKQKQIFLFLHIPQAKWTANGIDTPAFFELIHQYPNIKAVFHGHEHDQDGVKMDKNIPFLFDSHIGGNWGTNYKGFRVVELMDDGMMVTYMMNPVEKMAELSY